MFISIPYCNRLLVFTCPFMYYVFDVICWARGRPRAGPGWAWLGGPGWVPGGPQVDPGWARIGWAQNGPRIGWVPGAPQGNRQGNIIALMGPN